MITEADFLAHYKKLKNITGAFHDESIKESIDEVIFFLKDAGVPEDIIYSTASVGVINRGVSDLRDGSGELSTFFKQRAIQLCYQATPDTMGGYEISEETIDEALGVTHV